MGRENMIGAWEQVILSELIRGELNFNVPFYIITNMISRATAKSRPIMPFCLLLSRFFRFWGIDLSREMVMDVPSLITTLPRSGGQSSQPPPRSSPPRSDPSIHPRSSQSQPPPRSSPPRSDPSIHPRSSQSQPFHDHPFHDPSPSHAAYHPDTSFHAEHASSATPATHDDFVDVDDILAAGDPLFDQQFFQHLQPFHQQFPELFTDPSLFPHPPPPPPPSSS